MDFELEKKFVQESIEAAFVIFEQAEFEPFVLNKEYRYDALLKIADMVLRTKLERLK